MKLFAPVCWLPILLCQPPQLLNCLSKQGTCMHHTMTFCGAQTHALIVLC